MRMSLLSLAELTGAELHGDGNRTVDHVATLQDAGEGAISFLANPRYKKFLTHTRASAVILSADDVADCPVDCLVSDNPYLAHARVMNVLYRDAEPIAGIHPSCVVDDSAEIADSVSIGPHCYVGAGVKVADRVVIGPGCVLLDHAVVGEETRLVATVTLCANTRLGHRCIIHPGAVIGSDGFGMANDQGAWVKIPQIGRAILGDDVEVGGCSSIDRGAIGDTVIADGVKIDNQVHIAHNVEVGEHTAIAGCAAIAGSSKVGAHCTIAGGAGLTGHIELTDNVHVSGVTSVTRSIRKPGVQTSTVPSMDHAAWLKNFARLRQLDDMARRISSLEKELAALRKREGRSE